MKKPTSLKRKYTDMKMKIYACGGAATNLASHFVKYIGKQEPGFAELDVVFIDTSKSNINSSIPNDKIYLVDGLDGSGKKRDSNYAVLSERGKEILHMHKPEDVNIVLQMNVCSGYSVFNGAFSIISDN